MFEKLALTSFEDTESLRRGVSSHVFCGCRSESLRAEEDLEVFSKLIEGRNGLARTLRIRLDHSVIPEN